MCGEAERFGERGGNVLVLLDGGAITCGILQVFFELSLYTAYAD